MTDRTEPSEKPDERVEKLGKILLDVLAEEWDTRFDADLSDYACENITLEEFDPHSRSVLRKMAEKLLANYVSKEEHKRVVREMMGMLSGGAGYVVTPIGGKEEG